LLGAEAKRMEIGEVDEKSRVASRLNVEEHRWKLIDLLVLEILVHSKLEWILIRIERCNVV